MITKDYLKSLKQTEVAALLDLSERRIQQLHSEGLPRNGTGRGGLYVWDAVLAWHMGRISGSGSEEPLNHGDRLKKVKADDAELDLAVKLGTLMEVNKVRESWANQCAAMRGRLLSIPSTAAVKIDPSHTQAQREEIIRKDIYEALENLAGDLP
jgi:phage terminase Nu1 subunit (DNA packaging protein)